MICPDKEAWDFVAMVLGSGFCFKVPMSIGVSSGWVGVAFCHKLNSGFRFLSYFFYPWLSQPTHHFFFDTMTKKKGGMEKAENYIYICGLAKTQKANAKGRKQKAESRKQKAESRKQKADIHMYQHIQGVDRRLKFRSNSQTYLLFVKKERPFPPLLLSQHLPLHRFCVYFERQRQRKTETEGATSELYKNQGKGWIKTP